jgi:dTDP-4-dehydrorhamnose reductase
MKKIFITGGFGLLGMNWAIQARKEYEVFSGFHKNNVKLNNINNIKINFDIIDEIVNFIRENKIDIVINTIALANIEECEGKPQKALHLNANIAENIARACHVCNVKLVHISTDHLFSGSLSYYSEKSETEPLNVYAKTKLESEMKVLAEHSDAIIIRTNFFCWGTPYKSSFSDFVISSLRESRSISCFDDVFHTPIITSELVSIVDKLIDSDASGIFNVVSDERISKYKFSLLIADCFNLDGALIQNSSIGFSKNTVKRPLDMSLSNIKTTSFLSYVFMNLKDQIIALKKNEASWRGEIFS